MKPRLRNAPSLKDPPLVAAFTLIELLVVVAIIALLIAVLLPGLGRAKSAAKQSVCLTNVRQLTVASLNYTVENKGCWVPWARPEDLLISTNSNDWGPGQTVAYLLPSARWLDVIWRDFLNKNIAALECPSQESQRNTSSTYQYLGPGGYRKYYPGYGINRQVVNNPNSNPTLRVTRVSEWENPQQKIIHFDSGKRILNGAWAPELIEGWAPVSARWWMGNAQGGASGAGLSGRHATGAQFYDADPVPYPPGTPHDPDTNLTGGSNIAYVDGHARFGRWIEYAPWASNTVNGTPPFNAGRDLYMKHWDPDGDGNNATP